MAQQRQGAAVQQEDGPAAMEDVQGSPTVLASVSKEEHAEIDKLHPDAGAKIEELRRAGAFNIRALPEAPGDVQCRYFC